MRHVIIFIICTAGIASADDTVVLLRGRTFNGQSQSLVATCLDRGSQTQDSQLCINLRLDFESENGSRSCLEKDSTAQEIEKHLNLLENGQYYHPATALDPAFNLMGAVASTGNSENIGPYLLALTVAPPDIALAPIELSAWGVSSLSVTHRMHKMTRILRNFVQGKEPNQAPGVSNWRVFKSMSETFAYPAVVNPEEYVLPICR